MPSGAKPKNILHQKFNMLTVIEYVGSKNKSAMWLCKCDCGCTTVTSGSRLRYGMTKSCGCLQRPLRGYTWKGHGDIPGQFLSKIRRSALVRNIDFCVDDEQLWNRYIEQNKVCALSGLSIKFVSISRSSKLTSTASLDRIDPKGSYTIDNIQWVHKHVNNIKNRFSQEEFLHFVYLINNPISDDGHFNYYSLDVKDRSKIKNWFGCGNLSIQMYKNYISGAKHRNIKFDITIREAWDLFAKQNGRCAMTGIPLLMSTRASKLDCTASLDRIDSNLGYTINNIQWIHKNINAMKWDFSRSTFLNYCHLINNYKLKTSVYGGRT